MSVSGGTVPYYYSWSSGGTGTTVTGLAAGIYDVTVTDANGCAGNASAAVSETGGPDITIDSIAEANCDGGGSIYIGVSGGTPPYTYSWSNGSITEYLIGVSTGDYDVTVTGSNGCMATATATISGQLPPAEQICMVTVDSAAGKNMVIWEKGQGQGIQAYNIYRESSQANVYFLADSVLYTDLSVFLDTLSDPLQRAYRYKISAVDSCGNESDMSDHHKTIHLTMNLGINDEINLIWNHYDGFSYSSYFIYRYTTANAWELIDSIPSNLNSYTDLSPPNDVQSYRVAASHPTGCTPTKSGNYALSRSNLVSIPDPSNSIELQVSGFEFRIYPNPNTGQFSLELNMQSETNFNINLYHYTGQLIHSEVIGNITCNYTQQMDLSGYAKGIYYIQIFTDIGMATGKVIYQ